MLTAAGVMFCLAAVRLKFNKCKDSFNGLFHHARRLDPLSILLRVNTLGRCLAISTEEGNVCDFLLALPHASPSDKGSYKKRKTLLAYYSINSRFLLRRKAKQLDTESVSIYLQAYFTEMA